MFNVKKLIAVFFVVCFAFAYTVPVHAATRSYNWGTTCSRVAGVIRGRGEDIAPMYYSTFGYQAECLSISATTNVSEHYTAISSNNSNYTMSTAYLYTFGDTRDFIVNVSGVVESVDLKFSAYVGGYSVTLQMAGTVKTKTN